MALLVILRETKGLSRAQPGHESPCHLNLLLAHRFPMPNGHSSMKDEHHHIL